MDSISAEARTFRRKIKVSTKERKEKKKKSKLSFSPSFPRNVLSFPSLSPSSNRHQREHSSLPLSLSFFSPSQPPSLRAFFARKKLELLQSPSKVSAFGPPFDPLLPPPPLPLSSLLPVISDSFLFFLSPPTSVSSLSGYLPSILTFPQVFTSLGSLVEAAGDAFSPTFHRYRALGLRPRPTPSSPVLLQPPRKHGSLPTTILNLLLHPQLNQDLSSQAAAAAFRDVPVSNAPSQVRRTPSSREPQRRSSRPFERST